MNNNQIAFIEQQFPVSKISKECYKERKAGQSQTLTGLGKWWGRKPLILVRSTILGLLMPVSDDPVKDREIFLKILSMDEEGLWLRKNKPIKKPEIIEQLTRSEKEKYFDGKDYKEGLSRIDIKKLQKVAFSRMSYDKKLTYCLRPEELTNISDKAWKEINDHLKTQAYDLQSLIQELGKRKFGKVPSIGDCFCGGGSIPFEAARMGCEVFASDLNPLAALLTWAGLNILSLSDDEIQELKDFQEDVFDEVALQVEEWGIEKNEEGWMAKYYLYCHETICPECGTKVPLSPSWEISRRGNVWALLEYNAEQKNFDIDIISGASRDQVAKAESLSTVNGDNMFCPRCKTRTPITVLRKDDKEDDGKTKYGLRKWEKEDIITRPDDVFQDRLYCIKYLEKKKTKTWEQFLKKPAPATDASYGINHYVGPTNDDFNREKKVLILIEENITKWKERGIFPEVSIEDGENTGQLIRERGWKYWHQLFNPREILLNCLFYERLINYAKSTNEKVVSLLAINKIIDINSKLTLWNPGTSKSGPTFANLSLNTMFNYAVRPVSALYPTFKFKINNYYFRKNSNVKPIDARQLSANQNIWITDPSYADAVNYHEVSEFFLSWNKNLLNKTFPSWYTDSKRVLAVKGYGESFKRSMVDIYRNLSTNMPENGYQVVMFTHQNPSVWADLTLILWSAGLHVTSAWNISTETESGGLKEGNYVKGTVLLVLKKLSSTTTAYKDELYPEIEQEVKNQIASMRELDDKEEPNFYDPDYLLAAYAASLKVLTSYSQIEDINIEYELSKPRNAKKPSPIEEIITSAIRIAYDQLIPAGFDSFTWKSLQPAERFYIKGLELEKTGIKQIAAYQEMARGFGIADYKALLASTKANKVRLKTAKELGTKMLRNNDPFSDTLVRHLLMAFYQAIKTENSINARSYLKSEAPDYDSNRNTLISLCEYFAKMEHYSEMQHREIESQYARYLIQLLKDDMV